MPHLINSTATHLSIAADETLNLAHTNTDEAFEEVVKDLNKSLNDLDLELKSIQDELNGRRFFAVVSPSKIFYVMS
jgi:hypothetical protein